MPAPDQHPTTAGGSESNGRSASRNGRMNHAYEGGGPAGRAAQPPISNPHTQLRYPSGPDTHVRPQQLQHSQQQISGPFQSGPPPSATAVQARRRARTQSFGSPFGSSASAAAAAAAVSSPPIAPSGPRVARAGSVASSMRILGSTPLVPPPSGARAPGERPANLLPAAGRPLPPMDRGYSSSGSVPPWNSSHSAPNSAPWNTQSFGNPAASPGIPRRPPPYQQSQAPQQQQPYFPVPNRGIIASPPHGAPGHLERDCIECKAVMDRAYAASRQTAAEEESARRRSSVMEVVLDEPPEGHRRKRDGDLQRATQVSLEEQDLKRALRESIQLDQERKRRDRRAAEQEERRVLEESRRMAEQDDESARRIAQVQTEAALQRSREQAEEDDRKRRDREKAERDIEQRVLKESRKEQELEWRRREEEERTFLQAIQDEDQGQASVWDSMQRDEAFAPAFAAHHRHSIRVRKGGRHQASSGSSSSASANLTLREHQRERERPLPRTPQLELLEPVYEIPTSASTRDEVVIPAATGTVAAVTENPFDDDAEAPPMYDEVAPARPPLVSNASDPGPVAVAARELLSPHADSGTAAAAPSVTQDTLFPPPPPSRPSPAPSAPPAPVRVSSSSSVGSSSMASRPLPRVPPGVWASMATPASVSSPPVELDSFDAVIGMPRGLTSRNDSSLSLATSRNDSNVSLARNDSNLSLGRSRSPLAVNPNYGQDSKRPNAVEEHPSYLSAPSPMGVSPRSDSRNGSYSSETDASSLMGAFDTESAVATPSSYHQQTSTFPGESSSSVQHAFSSDLSTSSSQRPSVVSASSQAPIPRFEQKTPEGVDWGYSSSPFEMDLYASPNATSKLEGKESFPTTITLRAHGTHDYGSVGKAHYFVIRAQTWKAVLRAMAWFGNTRIEAGPEEVVEAATIAAAAASGSQAPPESRLVTDSNGSCKLMIDLEFVTPQRWDVPLAPIRSDAKPGGKPARVAVCLSLVQHRSPDLSSVLAVNHRQLDTICLSEGSSRRLLILPQRPPSLPMTVVDLAQQMHASHAFSAAAPATSSSTAATAASPRDLHLAIEKHDVKFFGKRRKEAAALPEGTVGDDPTGLHIASTEDKTAKGALGRMKGAVMKKLVKRKDDQALNEDLSTWITPLDLSEYG